MIYQTDEELMDWLFNGMQRGGGFIKSICEAAMRADSENYALIRPALLELKKKHPKYSEPK